MSGLANRSKTKRRAMAEYIRTLPHDEATAVGMAVYDTGRLSREKPDWTKVASVLVIVMPAVLIFLAMSTRGGSNLLPLTLLLGGTVAFVGLLACLGQVQAGPLTALAEVGLEPDERLVGPLLRRIPSENLGVRMALLSPLAESLPLLSADGFAALSQKERSMLNRLMAGNHIPLQIATLDVLSRNHSTEAIPQIEMLLRSRRDSAVVRAAEACLTQLQEHRKQEEVAATMLRPSQIENAPTTLLRPAASSKEEDELQLLRPKDG